MSERTRLDEIVDEETTGMLWPLGPVKPLAPEMAKIEAALSRIARRAFEHGVERCGQSLMPERGYPFPIQPAPAGEKP